VRLNRLLIALILFSMLTNAIITDCKPAGSISYGIADQIELREATYANDTGYAECNYTVMRVGYPDDTFIIEDGATDNLNNGLFSFNTESDWDVGNYEVKYFCLGYNALTNRKEFSFPCRTFSIVTSDAYIDESVLSKLWGYTGGFLGAGVVINDWFKDLSGYTLASYIFETFLGAAYDGIDIFWSILTTFFKVLISVLTLLVFLLSIISFFITYSPFLLVVIEGFICAASFGKDPLTNIETFINLNVIFIIGTAKFVLLIFQGLKSLTIDLLRTLKGFAPGG